MEVAVLLVLLVGLENAIVFGIHSKHQGSHIGGVFLRSA